MTRITYCGLLLLSTTPPGVPVLGVGGGRARARVHLGRQTRQLALPQPRRLGGEHLHITLGEAQRSISVLFQIICHLISNNGKQN